MTEGNGKEEFDLGQRQTLLMMKAFLCSETLFFVALIIGFVFFRHYTADWAESQRALDWKTSGAYTVALILSSLTLNFAVRCYERSKTGAFLVWAASTVALGFAFLGHQIVEYNDLYRQSITMSSSIFGSAFYTLTGFHTLHVAVGLVVLSVIFTLMAFNKLRCPSSGARAAEYYWHFVDVVWIVVFTIVYLGGVVV
jgi:heme/copper-type cytochrome/quinol oxidase subunit 3